MEKINKNLRQRNWILTIYDFNEINSFSDHRVRYAAYGDEVCPTTGREHKQAFCCFWNPIRFAGMKKLFPKAHILPMHGTIAHNEAYCSKMGAGKYHEIGSRPMTEEEQGEQGTKYWDAIKESARKGQMDLIPSQVYIRYKRTFDEMARESHGDISKLTCDIVELRDWQTELIEYIEGPVHPREILFIVDPVGGKGKSSMGVYLMQNYQAQVFTPAKRVDIYHMIKPGPLYVFDCSAASMGDLDQGMLEEIKNGYVVSTKYEPRKICFPRPHVIVFCNNMVQSTLMPDRIKIKEI